jgi:UDP-2,4-diacetamido-2,4,6-trideoxy-beta-L-altropyranose hydrolase
MNLYVRADADSKIGTGHIMRCIALAQAWQDQEGEVTFISNCESEALRERIQREKFRFIPVGKVCCDPSDLTNTLSILRDKSADQKKWLVLDGYHFTPDYQRAIRDAGTRLLIIDDMNHLPHYHADILLNQNIHALDLKYHCDEDTTLLLGTHYTLLRRVFSKYKDFKRQIPERAKNILVTLGGGDPDNVTLKVIEALKLLNEPDIAVKIIIGSANPHQAILRKALAPAHFVAELLINSLNMPELMAWADMAVSAGGSTCWELVFMGVPFLAIVLAENQRSIVVSLDTKNVAINCGDGNKITTEKFCKIFSNILCNREERALMYSQGSQLNDGNGSIRVYSSMKRLSA